MSNLVQATIDARAKPLQKFFMRMNWSNILVLVFLVGLLTSCSDSPPEVEEPVEPEVAEPVPKTAGQVELVGIPEEDRSVLEVIIVKDLAADTRAKIERQRQLFEYKVTGSNPELERASSELEISPEDRVRLDGELRNLSTAFPEQLTLETVNEETKRLRKFQSDRDLFLSYRDLFRALSWDNLERGLKFINEKIHEDGKLMEGRVSPDKELFDQTQLAFSNLKWLEQVSAHLNAYLDLVNDRVDAKNDFAEERARLADVPKTWDDFVERETYALIAAISKDSVGASYIEPDGSFEVEGQGELIVRVEYGAVSAYFFPEMETENRVKVSGLREWEEVASPVATE